MCMRNVRGALLNIHEAPCLKLTLWETLNIGYITQVLYCCRGVARILEMGGWTKIVGKRVKRAKNLEPKAMPTNSFISA